MKKFNEVLEEIKATHEAIRAAEARENELVESYIKICDLRERHEARKAAESDMMKMSEEKNDLQITIKILKNNAKISLFYDAVPAEVVLYAFKGWNKAAQYEVV